MFVVVVGMVLGLCEGGSVWEFVLRVCACAAFLFVMRVAANDLGPEGGKCVAASLSVENIGCDCLLVAFSGRLLSADGEMSPNTVTFSKGAVFCDTELAPPGAAHHTFRSSDRSAKDVEGTLPTMQLTAAHVQSFIIISIAIAIATATVTFINSPFLSIHPAPTPLPDTPPRTLHAFPTTPKQPVPTCLRKPAGTQKLLKLCRGKPIAKTR